MSSSAVGDAAAQVQQQTDNCYSPMKVYLDDKNPDHRALASPDVNPEDHRAARKNHFTKIKETVTSTRI